MRYLITGGCGFIGSNLARAILEKGEELFIIDNLGREGSRDNSQWLKSFGQYKLFSFDMRCSGSVEKVFKEVKPELVFHLAGQVAMTTSIDNPRLDFETNVIGGHNLLESARTITPYSTIIYSSTNKVYGDLAHIDIEEKETRYTAKNYPSGFDEELPLDFHSPYGCSKGAVDQYMLDYARIFDLKTIVFRHSSVFGGRQFSTFDQGWIGWFVKQALGISKDRNREAFTVSGNGKQVRDVLFIEDLISCYFKAADNISETKGQAFNIGGGANNSLSLIELFSFLEKELAIKMEYRCIPWRKSDQLVFVSDIQKANKLFHWYPKIDKSVGLKEMIGWEKLNEIS